MARDPKTTFADIDTLDLQRFVAHLAEDVVFRFGNNEPLHGRAAVRDAVAGSSPPSPGCATTCSPCTRTARSSW